jgi:hypothetical protein
MNAAVYKDSDKFLSRTNQFKMNEQIAVVSGE